MTGIVSDTLSTAIARTIGHESAQVAALRTYNEEQRDHDPSKVAWPATLVLELALKTAPPCALKEEYGYTDEEWEALRYNPVFIRDLATACEEVKKEGNSFRAKARLQAEELLTTSWKLIHGPGSEVQASVKADLIKTIFRVAGFDSKDGIASPGNSLQIQINLGG